jgi:preprotein translocase subunit SecE
MFMSKIGTYIQDSTNELVHKTSWPTWPELQNSAVVVLVASSIIAMVVLGMDSGFQVLMEQAYKLINNL